MQVGSSRRSLLTMGTSTSLLQVGSGPLSPGGSPVMSPLSGTLTLDTSSGVGTGFSSGAPLSPSHGPVGLVTPVGAPAALTTAQLKQRALDFEKEILSDIEEVTVQVRPTATARGERQR